MGGRGGWHHQGANGAGLLFGMEQMLTVAVVVTTMTVILTMMMMLADSVHLAFA